MSIGTQIKKQRLKKGYTLEELAKQIGTSKQTIQRYETGTISNIPSDKIEALAIALGVSPAYLMGWEEKEESLDAAPPTPRDPVREKKYEEILSLLSALPENKLVEAVRYLKYLADN